MEKVEILKSIDAGNQLKGYQNEVRDYLRDNPRTIVILDDDPTGTQTTHDIPVITSWEESIIEKEISHSPVFFILTNSRSLQADEADELAYILGQRLRKAAKNYDKNLLLISRGDSTLRGHYPNEVNALCKGLEVPRAKHFLAPAFFDGGRYTYHDIHWVMDKDNFIPAAETNFAQDATFGYNSSNLKDWIVEKTNGSIDRSDILSISVDQLRNESTALITSQIDETNQSHLIVNATSDADLQKMALAALRSKTSMVYRTAASFVNALTGIEKRELLTKNELLSSSSKHGALLIIGSYVNKSTSQFNYLKEASQAVFIEFNVSLIFGSHDLQSEITKLSKTIDTALESGQDVVLYTSRKLITGKSKTENLNIVNRVSESVIQIVKQVKIKPKYILAKGGITSSDIATKALNVQRATVLGQIIKGVPVWKLGKETAFPDTPYIIFPGNVGDEQSLYKVVNILK